MLLKTIRTNNKYWIDTFNYIYFEISRTLDCKSVFMFINNIKNARLQVRVMLNNDVKSARLRVRIYVQ